MKKTLLLLLLLPALASAQKNSGNWSVGLNYGLGREFKNSNYTFTNRYYKGVVYYSFKKTKRFHYEIVLQPEVNFATHQLLNLYFVKPDEENFEAKRAAYTQLKDITEYVLGVGFLVRKPLSKQISVYLLGSIGPMITDTETERLSKGFAFSDVLSLGVTLHYHSLSLDIRPSIRHTSNAGLQGLNAGFNTFNFESGLVYRL